MGQQFGGTAFALLGNIIGGVVGGPIGAAVGGMAGGLLGSMIFRRSNQPLIPDYQIPSAAWGHPIPIIFGTVRLPSTVIWMSSIQTKAHGIGKGFGASTYSYWQSAAFAFCEGPAQLLKIWTDGNLFYDATSSTPHERTKYTFTMRNYIGAEDQVADPLLQQWVSDNVVPGDACPAYRDLSYLVFQQIDLAHYGNRMPNITALLTSTPSDSVKVVPLLYSETTLNRSIQNGDSGAAVDWVRMYLYTETYDSVFRVFDLRTGQCILTKTWTQLWAPALPPDSRVPSTSTSVSDAIACVPGSYLYVSTAPQIFTSEEIQILRVDPNTLTIISWISFAPPLTGVSVVAMEGFELVSPLGTFDMLVGELALGGFFITDAIFGHISKFFLNTGLLARGTFCIGKQDQISGTVELWFLIGQGISNPELQIWRIIVAGNDVSAITETGLMTQFNSLYPADFDATPVGVYQAEQAAIYDATDDTLIISDSLLNRTVKWSPIGNGTVIWVQPSYSLNPAVRHHGYWDTTLGTYGDGFGANGFWANGALAGERQSTYTTTDHGIIQAVYTYGYSSQNNAVVFNAGTFGGFSLGLGDTGLGIAYLQRRASAEVPVADIIAEILTRAGFDPSMYDVSAVTATTQGYAILQQKSYGAALADLCQIYQIDMVESDYALKFVPRGQAAVATITQDHLLSVDGKDPSRFWLPKNAPEEEMPLQINLRYIDPAIDYQASATYSKRIALPTPTQFSRRVKTVDLPIVASSLEARQIAENWLYTMWAERDTFDAALSWEFLYLDPTDNVQVNLDNGDQYGIRIEQTEIGADYSMRLTLCSEDNTTYVPSSSPGASVSYQQQVLVPTQFMEDLLFNVPLLQDADDLGGTATRIYFAAGATNALQASDFAVLNKSTDAVAFSQFATVVSFPIWGHLRGTLGSTPSAFATDYVNTLTVVLAPGSDSPVSCTYLDLMNGVNAAVVGKEIIQFQNAATNADGSITLSTLVRGRRGTDWAIGQHAPGELFILLVSGQIQGGRLTLGEIGQLEYYKLVPAGRTIDQAPTDAFKYLGYDLKPYAPIGFSRTLSGGNLVLAWVRRTRIGGLLQDGTDTVPLNEQSEAYEAYILASAAALASFDPTNAATYVRAFTGLSAPTVTYTSAMMTADGFTPATQTLYLVVYQISAVIGRGFQGYQALPPF